MQVVNNIPPNGTVADLPIDACFIHSGVAYWKLSATEVTALASPAIQPVSAFGSDLVQRVTGTVGISQYIAP